MNYLATPTLTLFCSEDSAQVHSVMWQATNSTSNALRTNTRNSLPITTKHLTVSKKVINLYSIEVSDSCAEKRNTPELKASFNRVTLQRLAELHYTRLTTSFPGQDG